MVVVVGTHLLDVVVVVVDVDFLQGLVQLEVEVDGVEEKKVTLWWWRWIGWRRKIT